MQSSGAGRDNWAKNHAYFTETALQDFVTWGKEKTFRTRARVYRDIEEQEHEI